MRYLLILLFLFSTQGFSQIGQLTGLVAVLYVIIDPGGISRSYPATTHKTMENCISHLNLLELDARRKSIAIVTRNSDINLEFFFKEENPPYKEYHKCTLTGFYE